MASFRDYLGVVLAGGLPALLDNPQAGATAQGDTRPEQRAPSAGVKDTEPFLLSNAISGLHPAVVIGGLVAGLALTIALVAALRK